MEAHQLADLEAIKQLKARYFRSMDGKAWAEFANVFTDDCVMVNGTSDTPPVTGRDAIVAYVSAAIQEMVTVHHGHMPEIKFTGSDTASGIWPMFDSLRGPGLWMDGFGHYHEDYRRCADGQWRISRTELTRLRVDANLPEMVRALWPEAPDWHVETMKSR